MEALIEYLFYSSLYISIIGFFQWFIVRKASGPWYNRRFIVMGIMLSLFLGFYNFIFHFGGSENLTNYSYQLPEVIIGVSTVIENSTNDVYDFFNGQAILVYTFFSISLLFMLRLIITIIYFAISILAKKRTHLKGLIVIPIKSNISPFSFFRYVFVSEKILLSPDLESILLHERAHILKNHFLDLLLMEVLLVFFWYHPAIWYLRKEIKLQHEYEADNYVLKQSVDKYNYQNLLLKMSIIDSRINLVNLFSHSPIKKRIIMMNKGNRNNKALITISIMIVSILFIAGTLFQSCKNNETSESDTIVVEPQISEENVAKNDSIYEISDVPPKFPGGMSGMIEFLDENIEYPEQSRQDGVEGTVFVAFIVRPDGKVTDVEIMRGVNPEIDAEALRVVKMMPAWNPGILESGETVTTQYRMPIRFVLKTD